MAEAKCDVVRLAQIVDRCFDYAMDARLSQARRTKFLVSGKRLRGSLLNIISARFNDTAALAAANARLDAINMRRRIRMVELARDVLGGSFLGTKVAVLGAATSQISYTASKGGVLALSRELGVEFGRRGVRVNALCPGPVNTPLLQELFAKDPEKAARRLVHLPMGRFAEAAEIAAAACFLASDDASYITASTFLVDGGLSAAYVTPEG